MNRFLRELGPVSPDTPAFPLAAAAVAPLRAAAESRGDDGFSPLWSGEAGALAQPGDAGEATRRFWREAEAVMRKLGEARA
jgi:nitronate monooxygenase